MDTAEEIFDRKLYQQIY